MHVSCLGVSPVILGNTLFEMFKDMGGLITAPVRVLDELLVLIKIGARNTGVPIPFSSLTFTMIRQDGKGPKLRCKAAKCRYALTSIRFVLENMWGKDTAHRRNRLAMIQHYDSMYQSVAEWSKEPTINLGGSQPIMVAGIAFV